MAKISRENKLRERRAMKAARKDARRSAAAEAPALDGAEDERPAPDDDSAPVGPAVVAPEH